MAEERSRVALKHMVLFSSQQRLPVDRNTRTFAASSVIAPRILPSEARSDQQHLCIYRTNIPSELLNSHFFCLANPHFPLLYLYIFATSLHFPSQPFEFYQTQGGGLQLYDNLSQTFGKLPPSCCTYGIIRLAREGRKYTARCFSPVEYSVVTDVFLAQ